MEKHLRECASVLFGALSHPTRLCIVELLRHGGKTVNEIASTLGLQQSGTSQHLAVLTRAGVLVVEPRGAARVYRVRGPRISHLLSLIRRVLHRSQLVWLWRDADYRGEKNGGYPHHPWYA